MEPYSSGALNFEEQDKDLEPEQNPSPPTVPLLINNKDVISTCKFEVRNPYANELVHNSASTTIQEVIDTLDAAGNAFHGWSETRAYQRRDILLKAAEIMHMRKNELVGYQCEETGAQEEFVARTVDAAIGMLKDFAGRVSSIHGVVPTVSEDGEGAMILKQPYGVILGIAPWYIWHDLFFFFFFFFLCAF